MSYSDVLKAVDMHGGALNKTMANFSNKGNNIRQNNSYASQGTNPWSSGAYTTGNYREFANSQEKIQDDRAMYSDLNSGMTNFDKALVRGAAGMQAYEMGKTGSKFLGSALGGPDSFNMGPAMAVRGAFGTDNNPYTFTDTERYGTTASNMMLGHQLSTLLPSTSALAGGAGLSLAVPGTAAIAAAPAIAATAGAAAVPAVTATAGTAATGINPYVALAALAYSWWSNKKKKAKTQQLNTDAAKKIGEEDTRLYEERSERLEKNRDDMLAEQGSYQHGQDASRYSNQYGGNYNNRYQYNKGGKLSSKEMKKVQNLGRRGDTMLAHINPQEAQMLKQMGGSGTINPYTGLREYNFLSSVLGGISDIIGSGLGAVGDIIQPVFDAAGNIVEPIFNAAGDVVNTVGEDVFTPAVEGIAGGLTQGLKGGMEVLSNISRDVLSIPIDVANSLLPGGEQGYQQTVDRGEQTIKSKRNINKRNEGYVGSGNKSVANVGRSISGNKNKENFKQGDWVADKSNPFIAPNVEEEIDYAAQGMKYKYPNGGKMNAVAEFTGNELIVNEQSQVEQALANNNYTAAAAPIRRAIANNQVTPGPETHKNNPMPVDADGNIYAGGGRLNFKVNKGAGVYDHASDQFKPSMTDKEISMVVRDNMAKWESNNMA